MSRPSHNHMLIREVYLVRTFRFLADSLPDIKTKRYIFKIHTARMSLGPDVDLEEFVHTKDNLSGADIKAVCTEAGLLVSFLSFFFTPFFVLRSLGIWKLTAVC